MKPEFPNDKVGVSNDGDAAPTAALAAASTRSWLVPSGLWVLVMLIGTGFAHFLQSVPLGQRHLQIGNIFYVLFAENEAAACLLQLAVLLVLLLLTPRYFVKLDVLLSPRSSSGVILGLVLLTFALCSVGTEAIYHRYGLAMDEFCADFQAAIFAEGRIAAPVNAQYAPAIQAIKPIFVDYNERSQTWMTPYLPVYSGIRAIFFLFGLEWLTNPLLGALSVLTISVAARSLFPDRHEAPLLAALFLCSSAQFLITSMSAYSMPAHLLLNLCWLCLYTRNDTRGHLLAPLVGLLAVGLHQPHVHLLFAFPFCFRLVLNRQWRCSLWYASTYSFIILLWLGWWRWVRPDALTASTGMMSGPGLQQLLIQPANFILIFSWQSAVAGILFICALFKWGAMPPKIRDLVWSCTVTFLFHVFFASTQGHGWGERYFYSVLGNFVLIAVWAWKPLLESVPSPLLGRFALGSLLIASLVQFPMRAFQVERVIRPFAEVDSALKTVPADAIVVFGTVAWYGSDLIRNDPFLRERPVRISGEKLSEKSFAALSRSPNIKVLPPQYLISSGLNAAKAR